MKDTIQFWLELQLGSLRRPLSNVKRVKNRLIAFSRKSRGMQFKLFAVFFYTLGKKQRLKKN